LFFGRKEEDYLLFLARQLFLLRLELFVYEPFPVFDQLPQLLVFHFWAVYPEVKNPIQARLLLNLVMGRGIGLGVVDEDLSISVVIASDIITILKHAEEIIANY
jgi:hypothetical protein